MTNLVDVCTVEDVMNNHVVPFLNGRDLARLEASSRRFREESVSRNAWRVLCRRDFSTASTPDSAPQAPVYDTQAGFTDFRADAIARRRDRAAQHQCRQN